MYQLIFYIFALKLTGTETKKESIYSYPVSTEVGSTELKTVDRESSPPAKKAKLHIETTPETEFQTQEFVRGKCLLNIVS
jgi:hypothetical protein